MSIVCTCVHFHGNSAEVGEGCSQWAITFHNCLSFLNTRSTLTWTLWLSFPFGFCFWMVLHSAGFRLECRTQTSARSTSLHSQRVAQKSDILLANGILISSVILQLFLINLKMHPLALSLSFFLSCCLLSPSNWNVNLWWKTVSERAYTWKLVSVCVYACLRQTESRSFKVRKLQWLMGRTASHNSEKDAF